MSDDSSFLDLSASPAARQEFRSQVVTPILGRRKSCRKKYKKTTIRKIAVPFILFPRSQEIFADQSETALPKR
jgi:hypothetical protein